MTEVELLELILTEVQLLVLIGKQLLFWNIVTGGILCALIYAFGRRR